MENKMSKYPQVNMNNRTLSKKEIRIIKELTTKRGPSKVLTWLKDHRYCNFIHEVYLTFGRRTPPSHITSTIETRKDKTTILQQIFDIPAWHCRSRGQDQKLTYRKNRFDESIAAIWEIYDRRAAELGHNLLWQVDLSRLVAQVLADDNRSVPRYNLLSNFYIVAKNKEEAMSVILTMFAAPIGASLEKYIPVNPLGLAIFCDYQKHNMQIITKMQKSFEDEIAKAENQLVMTKKNASKASYICAIASQTNLMVNSI